ncbi:MAG: hypothetical protein WKF72_09360, partial [Nocardioidaceae bacterium]
TRERPHGRLATRGSTPNYSRDVNVVAHEADDDINILELQAATAPLAGRAGGRFCGAGDGTA